MTCPIVREPVDFWPPLSSPRLLSFLAVRGVSPPEHEEEAEQARHNQRHHAVGDHRGHELRLELDPPDGGQSCHERGVETASARGHRRARAR